MESVAILAEFLIKWGVLAIAIIGLLRLIAHKGDGKKHLITKMLTCLLLLFSLIIFVSYYRVRRSQIAEISGDYKVRYYKCEECLGCTARLRTNGTYALLKNGVEIDKGSWDFEENLLAVFIHIENGVQGEVVDSTRTISYIKNEGCQKYWRNQNLLQEIDGTIIKIDSAAAVYGVYSFIYRDSKTNDTVRYEPKYLRHPWLNGKLSPGFRVHKEKYSLVFRITKPDGKVVTVLER